MSLDKRAAEEAPSEPSDAAVAAALNRTQLPLYLSAAALLRSRIERGEWGVGEKLPSMEVLATQIPVARLTLRQALASLEKEGIVDCRHGRGTFVARDISHRRRLQVATNWSSLIAGITNGVQTMIPVAAPARHPRLLADEGELAPAYVFFKSVFIQDGVPYECMRYHIAKHIVDLDPRGFASGPVLPRLARLPGLKVKSARQSMVVSTSDVETSELLHIPLAAPVVLARRVVLDDNDIAIFVNDITYRGDFIRFEVDLLPGSPFRTPRKSVRSRIVKRRNRAP